MPYAQKVLPQGVHTGITVYVCGAVAREGYYTVEAGTDWMTLFSMAGLLPQSMLPLYYTDVVDASVPFVTVDYFDGTKRCSCVNVNSPLIVARLPVEGLPAETVGLLADWIELNGIFRNKQQVLDALGDCAEECGYKLYVAKEDYAETV